MAIKYYSATDIAKMVRADLKEAYPELTTKKLGGRANYFRVTSSKGSYIGSSIEIEWKDYPSPNDIEELTSKYVTKYFDGMTDSWENYEGKTLNGEEFVGICRPHLDFTLSPEREKYLDKMLEERGMSKNSRTYHEAKQHLNNQLGYIPEGQPIEHIEPKEEEILSTIENMSDEFIIAITKENQNILRDALTAKGYKNKQSNKLLKDNIATTILCTFYSRNKNSPIFSTQIYTDLYRKGLINTTNPKQMNDFIKKNILYQIHSVNHLLNILQRKLNQHNYYAQISDMLYAQVIRKNTKEFIQLTVNLLEETIKEKSKNFVLLYTDTEEAEILLNRLEPLFEKEVENTDMFRFYVAKQKEFGEQLKKNIQANLTYQGEYEKEKPLQKIMVDTLFLSARMSRDIQTQKNISADAQKTILDKISKNELQGNVAEDAVKNAITLCTESNVAFYEYQMNTNRGEEIIYEYVKSTFSLQDFVSYSRKYIDGIVSLREELLLLSEFLVYGLRQESKKEQINAKITELVNQKLTQRVETINEYNKEEHKMLASKYLKSSFENLPNTTQVKLEDLVNPMVKMSDYIKLVNQHYVNKMFKSDEYTNNYLRLDIITLKGIPFLLSYNKTLKMYQLDNLFMRFQYDKNSVKMCYQVHSPQTKLISNQSTMKTMPVTDKTIQHSLLTYGNLQSSIDKKMSLQELQQKNKRLHRLQETFSQVKNKDDGALMFDIEKDDSYVYLKPKSSFKTKQHYLLTDNKIVVLHVNSEGNMEHFTEIYSTEPSSVTTNIALKTMQQECQQGKVPQKFMQDIGKAIDLHKQAIDLRRKLSI